MKKLILVLALLTFTISAGTVSAQTPNDYKKELRSYMIRSGSMASFDTIIDQIIPLMSGNLSDADMEEIRTRAYDSLVDMLLPSYQNLISLEDIQALNNFYQTPAGRRISAAQPQLLQASMVVGQQWGTKLQQIIQEVMAR